jgi:hypothetical protein
MVLLTFVALLTISWFLLLGCSREVQSAVEWTLIFPFSGSIVIWLLWFGIREYSPPVHIAEHWFSVGTALVASGLAILASVRILRTQLMARIGLAIVSLSVALLSLFGAVLSVPVS